MPSHSENYLIFLVIISVPLFTTLFCVSFRGGSHIHVMIIQRTLFDFISLKGLHVVKCLSFIVVLSPYEREYVCCHVVIQWR